MELHALQLDLGLTRENVQSDTKLGPSPVSETHEENNTSLLYYSVPRRGTLRQCSQTLGRKIHVTDSLRCGL